MRQFRFAALVSLIVPAAMSAQKPRDLTKVDPCQILTSADVTAATKGTIRQTMRLNVGVGCMWTVEAASGTGMYGLSLEQAKIYEENWKVLATGTPLSGPWSAGDLTAPGPNGPDFALTALRRGDVTVTVSGPNKEAVIALTKTALSRLR